MVRTTHADLRVLALGCLAVLLVVDALGQVVGRTIQKDRNEKMIIVTLQRPAAVIPEVEPQHLQVDPVFKASFQSW